MTHFLTEDFLLDTQAARRLYHDYAVGQPIYDYHCHLPPEQIANDYQFANLYDIWLKGDHYKWRLMRANGMTEHVCTGDAADYEKYCAWAETVPYTIGNPLYHWTHLELLRYFGINNTLLTPQSAKVIWDQCNEQLKQSDFSARRLINRMNVKMIGTTDDPIDSLIHHKKLSQDSTFTAKVLPSWRPDKAFNIRADIYPDYIRRLSEAANKEINSFQSLCDALHQRMDYFAAHGCKIADHAIDVMGYQIVDEHQLDGILQRRLDDKAITCDEEIQFRTAVLLFLSQEYRTRNWVQQYHMSALRNNDSMLFKQRGPDIGFDSMNDRQIAEPLSRLLDGQKRLGGIPKTILYSLNPSDNAVLASMAGNFQGDGIPGKVQFGSAWWFNDQKQGMTEQMTQLAQMGLLSRFIGMTTDSRSFLSYTRHEYFRRILCQLMGSWVEKGEAPNDMALLGHMVQEICFGNAKRYFSIELTD